MVFPGSGRQPASGSPLVRFSVEHAVAAKGGAHGHCSLFITVPLLLLSSSSSSGNETDEIDESGDKMAESTLLVDDPGDADLQLGGEFRGELSAEIDPEAGELRDDKDDEL